MTSSEMNQAHTTASPAVPVVLSPAAAAAVQEAVKASIAASTRAAYDRSWQRFTAWCTQGGHDPGPPADPLVLAAYLTEAAALVDPDGSPTYRVSTLQQWVAGIGQIHRAAGVDDPGRSELVRRTLAGLRNTRREPPRQVRPVRLTQLRRILSTLHRQAQDPATASTRVQLAARRDAALLLSAWYGGARESELVGLAIGDVQPVDHDDPDLDEHTDPVPGLVVTVRTSKTDQAGQGRHKFLPRTADKDHLLCPVCAVHRWREILDAFDTSQLAAPPDSTTPQLQQLGTIAVTRTLTASPPFDRHLCGRPLPDRTHTDLPLFRPFDQAGRLTSRPMHRESFRKMLLGRAAAAGLSARTVAGFGGHSPRAGFVTAATEAGATDAEIAQQTWQSSRTIDRYRRSHITVGNAVTRLGRPGRP